MSETAQATRFGAREWAVARPWLAARWFPLGVAAITTTAAAFLFHQLLAWPPHEDEALPLFIGRHPLDQMFQVVLEERGGAPLHFLLAWTVAHLELGLGGLRAVSAFFAVASLPVIALLLARLGGRVTALVGTILVATSWTFLFHGVYGRMYSLFLFTAALSYLALLTALERGGRRAWALWALAILATVATHPYGALVLASQGAFVVVARRDRLREGIWAFGAVAVVGVPFWLTDLVLAGRFDAGVAAGSRLDVIDYVWQAAGDFTAGFPVLPAVFVAAAAGLAVLPRETRILAACSALVPLAALVVARSTGSPETRHLIFLLPFVALAVGAGIARLGRIWGSAAVAALVVAQLAWAWDRTPELFEWEPDVRQEARADAAGVHRGHDRERRRPARLRPALPAGLGAEPERAAGRTPAGRCRPGAAQPALAGAAARARHLGARLEQDDQHRALAADPARFTAARVGVRGPRLRAVPRHPHPRSRRDAAAVSRTCGRGNARRQASLSGRCRHQPADGRARRAGAARLRREPLALDELAVAGRLLEGCEPGGRLALPVLGPEPARGGDRRGGADGGADEEGARSRAAGLSVHGRIVSVFVTLGDLLLDVIVRLTQPLAEGADADAVTQLGTGGQAANVAAWIAELGGEARFVGKRADDEAGRTAAAGLERYGVEVRGPVVSGRTGTVVSLVGVDGARTMASDRGVSPT